MLEIKQAWIDTYESNLRHELQEKQSLLSPAVTIGTMTGKKKRFTYIGAAEMLERTDKDGNTNWQTQDFYSRWISRRIFDRAVLIDEYDDIESALCDPTGDLLRSSIMAANRQKDKVIIEAVTADAYTGENATTVVSFNTSTNAIPVTLGSSDSSNTPLNLAKIKELAARMAENDVPEDDEKFIICNRRQMNALLNDDHLTSRDFTDAQALTKGLINKAFGFTFICSNQLALASNVRTCVAWAKSCMQMAISTDLKIKGPVPIAQKHFNPGFEVTMALDAVRLYDGGVFTLPCKE